MNKLVEMSCDVDDFCRVFIPQWEKQLIADGSIKQRRPCRMAMSEIMTILIAFHTSNHRDFKSYYKDYIAKFYRSHFPNLLNYTRFLEVIPKAIVPLFSYFSILKGESTGIEVIDSTNIKVCHNLKIPRHKTFSGIAERGKETMGWFYGFKLHLITNFKSDAVDAKLTSSNVHDTKPVLELTKNLRGKLYDDKGYISKKSTANLKEKGVDLITNVRSNMKAKFYRYGIELCYLGGSLLKR